MNPIIDFGIDKSTLPYVGHDLQRPECILAEPDGTLWSADARGGVMRIAGEAASGSSRSAAGSTSKARTAKLAATWKARCRTVWRLPVTAISSSPISAPIARSS